MQRILTRLILGAAMLFLQTLTFAQDSLRYRTLDSLFGSLEANDAAMGSVSILQNGREVYAYRMGFASLQPERVRPTVRTKYRIGSVSKLFTAVLILQLIEENKLSGETRLSDFYPEIQESDSITIHQLLNHHSGLPTFTATEAVEQLRRLETKEAVIELAARKKGDPADRITGKYNNLNYLLLGFIVERVTGQSLETVLRSRITEPLGLTDTYLLPGVCSPSDQTSLSYTFENGNWTVVNEQSWNYLHGAGQMVSTPKELNTFIDALFGGKLVSPATLADMLPADGKFGLGLQKTGYRDIKGYGHSGHIDGFLAVVSHFPSEELSIAITLNGQAYPLNDILVTTLDILHDRPYELPLFEEITLADEMMERYEGRYSNDESGWRCRVRLKDHALQLRFGNFGRSVTCYPVSADRFINKELGLTIDFVGKNACNKQMMVRFSGGKESRLTRRKGCS